MFVCVFFSVSFFNSATMHRLLHLLPKFFCNCNAQQKSNNFQLPYDSRAHYVLGCLFGSFFVQLQDEIMLHGHNGSLTARNSMANKKNDPKLHAPKSVCLNLNMATRLVGVCGPTCTRKGTAGSNNCSREENKWIHKNKTHLRLTSWQYNRVPECHLITPWQV